MKSAPEAAMVETYLARCAASGRALGFQETSLFETDISRKASPDDRRREETAALRAQKSAGARLIALDERGRSIASTAFAGILADWRDQGAPAMVAAIGGPDGHDPALRDEADLVLSFGPATWPHLLVRVMLCEQIYRAMTILAGHPYHRA